MLLTLAVIAYAVEERSFKENTEIFAPSFAKQVNSRELKKTRITPVLDEKITAGENLIFCSTFQMAWNELCNKYAEGTLEIENAPVYAAKLNALYKQPPLLDEASYIAMSGLGKENIAEKINETIQRRFGHLKPDERPEKLVNSSGADVIIAFSYLYKNLRFPKAFDTIAPITMNCGGKRFKADAFGVVGPRGKEELFAQVRIMYFNDGIDMPEKPNGVILSLKTGSETDEIIISTTGSGDTLRAAYDRTRYLINSNIEKSFIPNQFEISNDELRDTLFKLASLAIPKLEFNFIHRYEELIGKTIQNETFKKRHSTAEFAEAFQVVALTLDEKGAKVMSYADVELRELSDRPKEIVISAPFIIYIRNVNFAAPYFMAYVANEEVMTSTHLKTIKNIPHYDELSSNPALWDMLNDRLLLRGDETAECVAKISEDDKLKAIFLAIRLDGSIKNFISCTTEDQSLGHYEESAKLEHKYEGFMEDIISAFYKHIDGTDAGGNTPLMRAAECGNIIAVTTLIKRGANCRIKRKDGKDALAIAREKKIPKSIEWIERMVR